MAGRWSGRPSRSTVLFALKLAVVLLVVGPFVVHAVPQVVGATASYVVKSDSMAPAIDAGDIVVVDAVDPASIREGDVITFQGRAGVEAPTTHRVVEVSQSEGRLVFETKGDANEEPDQEPVPSARVVGEVVFVFPYLGYVVQFTNTIYGFVALVVVPLGLLILTEIWTLIKSTRSSSETDATRRLTEEHPSSGGFDSRTFTQSPDVATGEGPTEPTGGADYTITPTDLRLTLMVLFAFTVFSDLVAFSMVSMWSVMMAVAATGGFLLVSGLVFFGGRPPEDELVHRSNRPDSGIANGTPSAQIETTPVSPAVHLAPKVPVDSLDSLLEKAVAEGRTVKRNPDEQVYFLYDHDAVYTVPFEDAPRSSLGEQDPSSGQPANRNRRSQAGDRGRDETVGVLDGS